MQNRLATSEGISLAVLVSLLVALLSVAIFAWLGNGVLRGASWALDSSLRNFAYEHSSPALTTAMRGISALGAAPVLVTFSTALILWFLRIHWTRAALWLGIAMAGAYLLTDGLKRFFERARPEPFHISSPETYSFPSGHSLNSFCFYFVAAGLLAARLRSRWASSVLWTVAALIVISVGVSRIYLGVHYPSDVLAGYAAAAIWVGALIVLDRLYGRRPRRGRRLQGGRT
jgi:undecaprenyl-diphosphatase